MDLFTIRKGQYGSLILEFYGLFVATCYNSQELQKEQEELIEQIGRDDLQTVVGRLLLLEKMRREPLSA